jgi:hypothetical protein
VSHERQAPPDPIVLHALVCPCCAQGRLRVVDLAGEILITCSACAASGLRIQRAAGFHEGTHRPARREGHG